MFMNEQVCVLSCRKMIFETYKFLEDVNFTDQTVKIPRI